MEHADRQEKTRRATADAARRLYCSYPLFLADWIKNIHTGTLIGWPSVVCLQVVFVHKPANDWQFSPLKYLPSPATVGAYFAWQIP